MLACPAASRYSVGQMCLYWPEVPGFSFSCSSTLWSSIWNVLWFVVSTSSEVIYMAPLSLYSNLRNWKGVLKSTAQQTNKETNKQTNTPVPRVISKWLSTECKRILLRVKGVVCEVVFRLSGFYAVRTIIVLPATLVRLLGRPQIREVHSYVAWPTPLRSCQ